MNFCGQTRQSNGSRPRSQTRGINKREWKNNRLSRTVFSICQELEYDANRIVGQFREYSSANFIYGSPMNCNPKIPEAVWQSVCHHYDAAAHGPYRRVNSENLPVRFKQKSDVFIGSKVTDQLVESRSLSEEFTTSKRLYQYLNWTMRISKVAGAVSIFEGQNGHSFLLVDTELHDHRGHNLYALCPPNDVITHRSQQWQLAALLTADELVHTLGIDFHALPRGVRASSAQFEQYRMWQDNLDLLKSKLFKMDSRRKPIRYAHLKCIQTGKGSKVHSKQFRKSQAEGEVMTVKLSTFYGKVQSALMDRNVDLVPIVSIVSKKNKLTAQKVEDFSVDYMLPVQVGNEWIGVVFRNDECTMALLDHYDISNKAILCDPSFNMDAMQWFRNSFSRLRIVPDEECRHSVYGQSVCGYPDDDTMSVDSRSTFMTENRSFYTMAQSEASSLSLSAYSNQSPSYSASMCSTPTMTPPPMMQPVMQPVLCQFTPPLCVQTMFAPVTALVAASMTSGTTPSVEELMATMNSLLADGEQMKAYFEQFRM